jgi:hypothetical protein
MNEQFDLEFKTYMRNKGLNLDPNLFDLQFNPPQNFASYRQAEMDTARVNTYGTLSAVPHISKRFSMKRFLGLTQEEIAENEKMWREENVDRSVNLSAQTELRSAGVTASGLESDMDELGSAGEAPEDMDMGMEGDMAAAPAPGGAPMPDVA